MTVTMTIEEFDELRKAKQTLDKVRRYLHENVCYSKEADICSCRDAWQFAKALPHQDVAMLVDLAGIFPSYKNVDRFEEDEA